MSGETNRVLMIAFHYPPCSQSSGIHRTLKFSRYLPKTGWNPIILSAHPRAYESQSDDQLGDIPSDVPVTRAFALDASRSLALRGFYPRWIALPDRFVSWWLGAVAAGLRLIRRHRPDAIWSTYPIATAHLTGLTLHRLTGLPWVADFRDPMVDDYFPQDRLQRRTFIWIERQAMTFASRIVFTAESCRQMYRNRYPSLPAERCLLIPNGYDEEDFAALSLSARAAGGVDRPLQLVHTGVIYPEERDPTAFFAALSRLKRDGRIDANRVRINLRASGFEDRYSRALRQLGIDDFVRLSAHLPYRQTLLECLDADGLLLLQGALCNHEIPAKAYEYLRAQRPILALTTDTGDTAALLRRTGGATIVDLACEDAIYAAFPAFVKVIRAGAHSLPAMSEVEHFSRHDQAFDLAQALSTVLCATSRTTPDGLAAAREIGADARRGREGI
jgi:glycosyltransferase involved in cell wall biosynthesis